METRKETVTDTYHGVEVSELRLPTGRPDETIPAMLRFFADKAGLLARLLVARRDCGAHTFRRIDRDGVFLIQRMGGETAGYGFAR